MSGARVEIETGSLHHSGTSITGTLVLHLGDQAFPEPGWNDFVVVVLSWWCDQYEKIVSPGSGFQLSFMDGPFVARGLLSADETITLNLGRRAHVYSSGSVVLERKALAEALRSAAANVVKECRLRGWEPAELYKLERVAEHWSATAVPKE